jgi:phage/plasmid-associated DNA primase
LDAAKFVEQFYSKIPFDKSVYKAAGKMQLMRLPYSGKTDEDLSFMKIYGNKGVKKFEKITEKDYAKCCITLVPEDAVLEGAKESFSESDDEDVEILVNEETKQPTVEEEEVAALVNCILEDGKQDIHWDDWKNVVWALRNIADDNGYDLRPLAHKFSKASDKYDKHTTNDMYDNIEKYPNANLLKMGSLVDFVKKNYEDAYFNWKKEYRTPKNKELALLHSAFRDGDVADYFCEKFKNEFIAFEGKLYNFNGVYWEEKTNKVLFGELKKLYFVLLEVCNVHFRNDDETYKAALGKILQLRTLSKQKSFVELILMELSVEEDVFDKNGDLLGFTNGTYELENGLFREGRPEDYITLTVGYDYEPTTTHRVDEFMRKVMPHEDERKALIELLATSLRGKTLEKFSVLTGIGGNGKDSLMTYLMKYVLGSFYFEANSSILTDELRSELSPGIAAMHKKRLVVCNEPKKVIRVNMMKHLTGGSNIAVRGLYSNKVGIDLHATLCMLCNSDKPRLDEVSEAVARRLELVPFRSLFRSASTIKNEFSEDTPYLYEGSDYFKSEQFGIDYRVEMMNLLLTAYVGYRERGYHLAQLPESMTALAKEYMADCDEFYTWFTTRYEKTTDSNDYIQVKNVFADFKNSSFYADLSKSARRAFTLKKLTEEVQKNPNLRLYYKEDLRIRIDGVQKKFRNTLLKWKLKEDENEED